MNLKKLDRQIKIKILFIFLLLLIPWSLSDYGDQVSPQKITSDLRFYEINTCSISLTEFLIENPNVLYQDHYKLRFNNYSSISCFGKITGIDQIGYVFYISIGTNTLINLFLQSFLWIVIFSFLRKEKGIKLKYQQILSILITAGILTIGIYAEQRFYSKTLYLLDLTIYNSYIYLYSYLLFVTFFSHVILSTRIKEMFNYIPYLFIIMGLFSGLNFYFLTIFFVSKGVETIFNKQKAFRSLPYLFFIILYWSYQALGKEYFLNPDKIRGLSNTVYNFLSVSYWSALTFFTLIGIFYLIKNNLDQIDFRFFTGNFLRAGGIILSFGYLGSSMPIFNFFSSYYFGLTKSPTANQSLFGFNFWNEKIAWRGMFPSAETIGEFFALGILLLIIFGLEKTKYYKINLEGFT